MLSTKTAAYTNELLSIVLFIANISIGQFNSSCLMVVTNLKIVTILFSYSFLTDIFRFL